MDEGHEITILHIFEIGPNELEHWITLLCLFRLILLSFSPDFFYKNQMKCSIKYSIVLFIQICFELIN